MKAVSCLLVLTAAVAVHGAAMNVADRADLDIGAIFDGDVLLSRSYLYRPSIVNTIQTEDFVYRGSVNTRITAIQVTEIGLTQHASVWIVSGGLGQNSVTIRGQTERGYGLYYMIDIWGQE